MAIDLIHIGLFQAGGQQLLADWAACPEIALTTSGVLPLVHAARSAGLGAGLAGDQVTITFDQQPGPDQRVVFSQEALSIAYLNQHRDLETHRRFHEHSAELMAMVAPGAGILMLTCEPERWVRAIYRQAVKEGCGDTLPRFLDREADLLRQSSDVEFITRCWRRHFGNDRVLTLPVELLEQDRDHFYRLIEAFSGSPQPQASDNPLDGEYPETTQTDLLRAFNRWIDCFRRHGNVPTQLGSQLEQALQVVRFGLRFGTAHPTPRLARILDRTAGQLPASRSDEPIADHPVLRAVADRFAAIDLPAAVADPASTRG